jgi:hypothetical protein
MSRAFGALPLFEPDRFESLDLLELDCPEPLEELPDLLELD